MFSKKFVNAEQIQSSKDEAALDRLKKLKGLQKQYETPLATFAGPSIKAATTIKKKQDNESDIDEDELMSMHVPSSDEEEEEGGGEWGEKEVISQAPSAALLPEDKELTALIEGSSNKREKTTKTRGELQRNLQQIGLAKQEKPSNSVAQLASIDQPGQHPNELNPYWKEGGSGLPQNLEETQQKQPTPQQQQKPSTTMDVKWLKRALLRCEQLAKDEGRSLEEVVAERYGSLEELEKQIEDAERKAATSISSNVRNYQQEEPSKSSSRKGGSSRSSFMNPSQQDRRSRHEPERRSRDEPDRKSDRDDRRSRDEPDQKSDRDDRRDEPDRDRRDYRRPRDELDRRDNRMDYERSSHRPVSEEESEEEEKQRREIKREQGPAPRPDNSNRSAAASLRAQLNFPSSRPTKEAIQKEEPPQPTPSSGGDRNKAAAAALRAQLFGGPAGPSTSSATTSRPQMPPKVEKNDEEREEEEEDTSNQEVVLRTSKRTGLTMPFMASSCAGGNVAPGGRRKLETHTSSGERLRFLPGEDHLSVSDMVAMEKASDARQQNDLYMRFSGKEKFNDDFDVDDAYVEKASKRKTIEKHEAAEKRRAVAEHKQTSKALASCQLCLDRVVKHLVIAFGEKSYLAVPSEVNLIEDHCQIIPRDHVKSATLLEDDAWEEVQLFKKSVFRMFADLGKDVVFMETCMPSRSLGHTVIECFPLEDESAELAPIFFKKALLESEGLWSENKKVIDIKDNIRKTIPSAFSYFAVEFGINGQGFAHIIENEEKFPAYFGKEVIGGMIDCEPCLWRRPAKDSIENQLDKACRLQRLYSKYNWTQQQQESSSS